MSTEVSNYPSPCLPRFSNVFTEAPAKEKIGTSCDGRSLVSVSPLPGTTSRLKSGVRELEPGGTRMPSRVVSGFIVSIPKTTHRWRGALTRKTLLLPVRSKRMVKRTSNIVGDRGSFTSYVLTYFEKYLVDGRDEDHTGGTPCQSVS